MGINEIIQEWESIISLITTIGLIIALIISGAALFLTTKTARKLTQDTAYKDVDDQITDVLKIAIDNPELRDREKTKSFKTAFKGNDTIRYNAYANICWNVCEAIYDKKLIGEKMKSTWEPVIEIEYGYHIEWLKENHIKFKKEFLIYIGIIEPQTAQEKALPRLKI